MRKSQIQAQVFVYILALLIMSFVLIYGYRAIKDMKERGELAELINFKGDLKRSISSISQDYGSIKLEDYSVPSGFEKVCFVDLSQPNSVAPEYPLIHDYVESIQTNNAEPKNVFLWPPGTESDYVGNITVQGNFHCFDSTGGIIKVKLEGFGNRALISAP